MTDPRTPSGPGAPPAELHRDLHALAEDTSRSIPELDDTLASLRSRRSAASPWKERLMPVTDSFRRRPWLTTVGLATAAALILSVVPVSYTRTVGHDVSVKLSNVQDVASAAGIAKELKSMLQSDGVAVKAEGAADGTTVTFEAFVPASAGVNAVARAEALAKELNARGYTATASAEPRIERQSGNVYAFARDLVVRVETEGKTAAQIENEIRQQFAAAGITNATVSVTDSGKERKVMIRAENHGEPGTVEAGKLDVALTKNGVPLGKEGARVEIRKQKGPDGVTLKIAVTSDGKTVNVDVPKADTMSDPELASRIRSALQSAGLDLDVQVVGGKIEIGDKK